MAVTRPSPNTIKFVAGDQDIWRGPVRVIGVLVRSGGTAAARLRLFDAVNNVSGDDCFDFDAVGTATLAETEGVTGVTIEFRNGISASLTGAGATAYLYIA
ncbi:MAG: hypothetical protein QN162_14670 [Armatimonadota bacterium]|nr:hypothetical protein [Armatimonadota bacterium]MDR7534562.1 hypothetical protein [Armatimonadota bacterium]